MTWRRPGLGGSLLYGALAAVAGGIVSAVARLEKARAAGRRAHPDRLPDGPLIIVSNHTSYADGILLALACRELGRSPRLLATAGVFRAPVLGSAVRALGFIPVHRGSAEAATALTAAAEALAAGEVVGLFPEGRITTDPDHWPERSKTGAVRLALRTGAPVLPIAFDGAHEVIGNSGNLVRTLRNLALPPEVEVLLGEPIDVVARCGPDPDEATVRRVADEVMGALVDIVEELRGQQSPHAFGVPRSGTDRPDR